MSEGRFLLEGEETLVVYGWASANNVLHLGVLSFPICSGSTVAGISNGVPPHHARITICSHIRCGTGSASFVGAMNCLSRA